MADVINLNVGPSDGGSNRARPWKCCTVARRCDVFPSQLLTAWLPSLHSQSTPPPPPQQPPLIPHTHTRAHKHTPTHTEKKSLESIWSGSEGEAGMLPLLIGLELAGSGGAAQWESEPANSLWLRFHLLLSVDSDTIHTDQTLFFLHLFCFIHVAIPTSSHPMASIHLKCLLGCFLGVDLLSVLQIKRPRCLHWQVQIAWVSVAQLSHEGRTELLCRLFVCCAVFLCLQSKDNTLTTIYSKN